MEINDIIFIFSLFYEAKETIYDSILNFEKINSKKFYKFYNNKNFYIYISGFGYNNSIKFIKKNKFQNNYLIFKFGTCANITNNYQLLNPFSIRFFEYKNNNIKLNYLTEIEELLLKLNIPILDFKLVTSEFVINDKNKNIFINKNIDFIDMETFYFINNYKNIIPILIATDYGDLNYYNDFKININKSSVIFRDIINNIIKNIN